MKAAKESARTPRDHSSVLESCKQAELDFPRLGSNSFIATWDARPFDRTRGDADYQKFDDELYQAALTEYLPRIHKGIAMYNRDAINSACAAMSSWLNECYRNAHLVGGSQHQNSAHEEVASCIRLLSAHCWFGPEQSVIEVWLQPGEKIEAVHWDRIETDRGRTLHRSELTTLWALSGRQKIVFTSPDDVEEAKVQEEMRRMPEQRNQTPWTANVWTRRDGRQVPLHDVAGREND
jgi:hypothetical protein